MRAEGRKARRASEWLFAPAQQLKAPSRMVNVPGEGRRVLEPKNSELWHKEVFA